MNTKATFYNILKNVNPTMMLTSELGFFVLNLTTLFE
jgi:hypothetical protein